MESTNTWLFRNINEITINQDDNEISLLLKNNDICKIVLSGDAIKNYNDNFIIILKADMDIDTEEMRIIKEENEKLHRENEDLKKVLWAVADKVKDFKKEVIKDE